MISSMYTFGSLDRVAGLMLTLKRILKRMIKLITLIFKIILNYSQLTHNSDSKFSR